MLPSKKLARTLADIAVQGGALETTADTILAIVKSHARTLPVFDLAVREAYVENGWKAGQGRPRGDQDTSILVPGTVKTYVSEVRRALRLKVQISRVSTFGELRTLVRKSVKRVETKRNAGPAELVGVRLARPGALIGVAFHDLSVLYAALPDDQQATLKRQVDRLVTHYRKALPDMPEKLVANG